MCICYLDEIHLSYFSNYYRYSTTIYANTNDQTSRLRETSAYTLRFDSYFDEETKTDFAAEFTGLLRRNWLNSDLRLCLSKSLKVIN